jgi:pimeloyl-ACP methyl ester carboxylesterase
LIVPRISSISQNSAYPGQTLPGVIVSGDWLKLPSGGTGVSAARMVQSDGVTPVPGATVTFTGMSGLSALVNIAAGTDTLPGTYQLGLTVLGQEVRVPFTIKDPPKITGKVTSNGKGLTGVTITYSSNTRPSSSVSTANDGSYALNADFGSTITIKPSYGGREGIDAAMYSFQFIAPSGGASTCDPNLTTCTFSNITADRIQDFTVAPFTTVFLIHGIGQASAAMQDLQRSLTGQRGQAGLDLSRFVVDAGFSFTECTGISSGADKLAQYIANSNAPAGIVLVGYSMGGLVSRSLLSNTNLMGTVLSGHSILGLVTLGTPHWGYPYLSNDERFNCRSELQDMTGSWNTATAEANPLSTFLANLNASWGPSLYGQYWLAAAGQLCTNPQRQLSSTPTGCVQPLGEHSNDGVVCRDSALYNNITPPPGAPTATWIDPNTTYAHTNAGAGFGVMAVMCDVPSSGYQLLAPEVNLDASDLFQSIVRLINEH